MKHLIIHVWANGVVELQPMGEEKWQWVYMVGSKGTFISDGLERVQIEFHDAPHPFLEA